MPGHRGRITVVVPSYNHASYVDQCLDSVLNQSRPPAAVFLVDDGSRDNTRAIVQQYRDPVQAVWRAHEGLRATVAYGLSLVNTDYVCILASDDRLEPQAFERLGAVLDAHPTVGMAYGRIVVIDAAGRRVGADPSSRPLGIQTQPVELVRRNYVAAPATLCRTAALRAVGEPRQVYCGDWERWLRLMLGGWYLYGVGDVVAAYRRHGGNLSSDDAVPNQIRSEIELLTSLGDQASFPPELLSTVTEALAARYRSLGWALLSVDRRQAPGPLIRAARLSGLSTADVLALTCAVVPGAYDLARWARRQRATRPV
jgi:glycosyltransferase involved in cell wall biosynthesis